MLRATGPAAAAVTWLRKLSLPAAARHKIERLAEVVGLLSAAAPELTVTVDPVEHRGFEYQTGLSFVIFARGVRGELGRGGRYEIERRDGENEPAVGFTLYMDTVLRAAPAGPEAKRLFLPFGTDPALGRQLRRDGWVTLAGLDPAADAAAEAKRLGCSHVLVEGEARALEE